MVAGINCLMSVWIRTDGLINNNSDRKELCNFFGIPFSEMFRINFETAVKVNFVCNTRQ